MASYIENAKKFKENQIKISYLYISEYFSSLVLVANIFWELVIGNFIGKNEKALNICIDSMSSCFFFFWGLWMSGCDCAPNCAFKLNSFRIESVRYHIWCNGKRKKRGKICLQVMNYIMKLLHLFFKFLKSYCMFFVVDTQNVALSCCSI